MIIFAASKTSSSSSIINILPPSFTGIGLGVYYKEKLCQCTGVWKSPFLARKCSLVHKDVHIRTHCKGFSVADKHIILRAMIGVCTKGNWPKLGIIKVETSYLTEPKRLETDFSV